MTSWVNVGASIFKAEKSRNSQRLLFLKVSRKCQIVICSVLCTGRAWPFQVAKEAVLCGPVQPCVQLKIYCCGKESACLKNGVPVTLPNFKLFILDYLLISSICLTMFVHLHAFHCREMPLLLKRYIFVYVCVVVCPCEYRCPQRSEEVIRSPGVGVMDYCELLYVGAELRSCGRVANTHNYRSFSPVPREPIMTASFNQI